MKEEQRHWRQEQDTDQSISSGEISQRHPAGDVPGKLDGCRDEAADVGVLVELGRAEGQAEVSGHHGEPTAEIWINNQ